jgi:protein involved in polysaccharide export with SLBB domain
MRKNEMTQEPKAMLGIRGWVRSAVAMLLVLTLLSPGAWAQQQQENQNQKQRQNPLWPTPSGLAAENLSNVAASALEIEAVLRKDRGLFIELKRWVAKDSADHGQIVRDADLEDPAIYQRLESDVKFRSVATALLQRYGYLLPQINPDSAMGKEQELLLQERVKWLAQHQEVERQKAAEQSARRMPCDLLDASCADRMNQERERTQVRTKDNGVMQPEERGTSDFEDYPNTAPPVQGSEPQRPLSRRGMTQVAQTGEGAGALDSILPQALRNEDGQAAANPYALPPNLPTGTTQDVDVLNNDYIAGTSQGAPMPFDNGGTDPLSNRRSGAEGAGRAGGGSDGRNSAAGTESSMRGAKNMEAVIGTPMVHEPQPYGNIPALYDMYLKASPRPPKPVRFGLDVFERPVRNTVRLPMDLPVGPDYVIGPGDGLAVDMWGGVSHRLLRTVDPEGRLSLPEVGPVLVSGKTLGDAQEIVEKVLRSQFRDISASLSLARLRSVRVYVVGDVERPGAYDISSLSTTLNALFVAGGPTARGSLRNVRHMRGDQLVEEVDVYDLLLHGVRASMQRLENGDSVLVPPLGKQVTVEGMVRRPAIYELRNEKNLEDVLELAGGILPSAALGHIEVQRMVAHDRQTMLSLTVSQEQDGRTIAQQLQSFAIQDGDAVNLFPIAPYNQDAIYLEGHVLRAGRYAYRQGMKLTDVVASYKDLLPEPAVTYGEIIRLNAPDFRLSVESFNLTEVFANPASAPELKPLDTVRIFGRFDFEDAPVISVLGDVRRPGTYRATGEMHVRDAIRVAGGLGPDAQSADAQLFSYLPDSQLRVTSVSLQAALNGNPADNIVLHSRDSLLIHRNVAKADPPSVFIEGEVLRPGRYPLAANMHVADLIQLGGGLKRGADTQTADLTMYQIEDTNGPVAGSHRQIQLPGAIAGDANQNLPLKDGDTLTIRQVPGWNDLGISVLVRGEVKYPGTYGLRPGEHLSSVLKRAGGFTAEAYPYGAVLQRTQVLEMQERSRTELLQRVQASQADLKLAVEQEPDPDRKKSKEAAYRQWQSTLNTLEQSRPLGRVTIRISSDLRHWENSPADIELRAGDVLTIPKRPSYVMVAGQVYNPAAVGYRPGKSAKWYLSQSGGPTNVANKKAIFVLCADGSVIGGNSGMWGGSSFDRVLQPGDMVVVPEKSVGAGPNWQLILQAAQLATTIAYTTVLAIR